jgi:long-chain acyl-CoA synthetase
VASPNKDYITKLAAEKHIEGSYEEICKNRVIRATILADMNKVAKKEGLNSLEQAKNIYF